jgi:hypothetical protein
MGRSVDWMSDEAILEGDYLLLHNKVRERIEELIHG